MVCLDQGAISSTQACRCCNHPRTQTLMCLAHTMCRCSRMGSCHDHDTHLRHSCQLQMHLPQHHTGWGSRWSLMLQGERRVGRGVKLGMGCQRVQAPAKPGWMPEIGMIGPLVVEGRSWWVGLKMELGCQQLQEWVGWRLEMGLKLGWLQLKSLRMMVLGSMQRDPCCSPHRTAHQMCRARMRCLCSSRGCCPGCGRAQRQSCQPHLQSG